MIKELLFVSIGAFIGGGLRYFIGTKVALLNLTFPWGTFGINLIGSLIIGVFMALSIKDQHLFRLLLITGFCGGFTTFSTFSLESLTLLKSGNYQMALIYVCASVLGGLLLVGVGYFLTHKFID